MMRFASGSTIYNRICQDPTSTQRSRTWRRRKNLFSAVFARIQVNQLTFVNICETWRSDTQNSPSQPMMKVLDLLRDYVKLPIGQIGDVLLIPPRGGLVNLDSSCINFPQIQTPQ